MIEALKSIIGDESRIIAGDIPDKYLSDTLGRRHGTAAALVFPVSTDEVAGVMRYAWEHSIPVTPRGAGTNLVGSTVPHGEGIVLDLSRMNHVLEIDEETFTATVEPGVVLEDFQAMVEAKGLFYPPDPGEKTATIAGNIATNAGGMRAVKYGVTRDYVRGLEVVTADGRMITRRHQERKGRERPEPEAPDRGFGGHAGRNHQVHTAPGAQARGIALGAGAVWRSADRHIVGAQDNKGQRQPYRD